MKLKAVLFDRDGTLTDFDNTWGPAIAHVISELAGGDKSLALELGKALDFDFENALFGEASIIKVQTPFEYSQVWASVLGVPHSSVFVEKVEALLLEKSIETVTPFSDTLVTIKELYSAGVPIGLATNGTEASAKRQLKTLGIDHLFSFIAGYDSGYGSKPEPGQLLAFAKHLGISPKEIGMVGDSLHDMHAARNGGLQRIGVSTGAVSHGELVLESDHVFTSLSGILPLFLGSDCCGVL
ncbi:HAD family hydrolase [Flexibacterium corallicola]|uniref:HAD family hydrolase n=1 Tax=Flexibacterium corallicola TaxID=3037259 RepID=UPI00286ECD98|nr:HAD family hydrolase [Pseudovibrio sp. M1P-2-3]